MDPSLYQEMLSTDCWNGEIVFSAPGFRYELLPNPIFGLYPNDCEKKPAAIFFTSQTVSLLVQTSVDDASIVIEDSLDIISAVIEHVLPVSEVNRATETTKILEFRCLDNRFWFGSGNNNNTTQTNSSFDDLASILSVYSPGISYEKFQPFNLGLEAIQEKVSGGEFSGWTPPPSTTPPPPSHPPPPHSPPSSARKRSHGKEQRKLLSETSPANGDIVSPSTATASSSSSSKSSSRSSSSSSSTSSSANSLSSSPASWTYSEIFSAKKKRRQSNNDNNEDDSAEADNINNSPSERRKTRNDIFKSSFGRSFGINRGGFFSPNSEFAIDGSSSSSAALQELQTVAFRNHLVSQETEQRLKLLHNEFFPELFSLLNEAKSQLQKLLISQAEATHQINLTTLNSRQTFLNNAAEGIPQSYALEEPASGVVSDFISELEKSVRIRMKTYLVNGAGPQALVQRQQAEASTMYRALSDQLERLKSQNSQLAIQLAHERRSIDELETELAQSKSELAKAKAREQAVLSRMRKRESDWAAASSSHHQ
jgi:hypothetical protein